MAETEVMELVSGFQRCGSTCNVRHIVKWYHSEATEAPVAPGIPSGKPGQHLRPACTVRTAREVATCYPS